MLFGPGRPTTPAAGWVEPKLDGFRVRLIVHLDGTAELRTRRNYPIRHAWVAEVAAGVQPGTVLDGELVHGQGRCEDFYAILGSLRSGHGLTVVAFDCLATAGRSAWAETLEERRERLTAAVPTGTDRLTTMPRFPGAELDVLLAEVERHGGEGVVWKSAGSLYRPGRRTPKWLKAKTSVWPLHAERRAADRDRQGVLV
jgi:ATP-dependent DNA ligase